MTGVTIHDVGGGIRISGDAVRAVLAAHGLAQESLDLGPINGVPARVASELLAAIVRDCQDADCGLSAAITKHREP